MAAMKKASFHQAIQSTLRSFPQEVRKALGKAILELQKGVTLSMPLSKPMPSVSQGAHEIRVKDKEGIYRVFYYTKVEDKILIFHAFKKKSQKTPKKEIDLARKRLKELINE